MTLRTLLISTSLVASLTTGVGCAKPRKLQEVDPHLKSAFELVNTDPDKALKELDLITKARPAQIEYIRGLIFEKKEQLDLAAEAHTRAVELDPRGTQTKAALARVQLLRGKTDEAREILRVVVEKDSSDLLSIILLSLCATNAEHRHEALSLLSDWPRKRPQSKKGQAQVPLRAEYYLALAAIEEDPVRAETARRNAKATRLASVQVGFTLVKYAMERKNADLAKAFLSKLASSEIQHNQLELVAKLSLSLGDVESTGRALARLPESMRTLDIMTLRGRHALALGHPRRALAHLRPALELAKKKKSPIEDQVEYLVAEALTQVNEKNEAIEVLEVIIARSPNHINAHLLLSNIEFSSGKESMALERLKELSKHVPGERTIWNARARLQLAAKDYQGAEKSYLALTKFDPENTQTIAKLAETLHLQKKEKIALEQLAKGALTFPDDINLLRSLATQHLRMNDPQQAISVVLKAKVSEAKKVQRALLLADIYDTLKRPQEVRKTLDELVLQVPESARSWSALARIQKRQNDRKGWESSLRKSIELNPRAWKDKARLATLLSEEGNSAEAARLFTALANATGKDVVALNNAAMLYVDELDNPERAVKFAEKALALAPTNKSIMDTLAWSLAQRGGQDDHLRAEALLKQARTELTSAESAYHYAFVLQKVGKNNQAKKLLKVALESDGNQKWRTDAKKLQQVNHQ